MGKDYWKRPRPFGQSNGLPAVPAEIFPGKREEIFAVGREMGWHRVQIGRHNPTDIYAGRVLGQAIVRELKKSSAFNEDFAEVKKEIAAAHLAEKSGAKASVPAK